MKTVPEFARSDRAIVMLAAYDALMARHAAAAGADALLVGDSVAMVVHGLPSTVHATMDMMVAHTAAVRRGAPDLLVVADLPFLAVRRGTAAAVEAAGALLRAGANAVKAEGIAGHADVLAHLVGSGIPVMGHLGLLPQAVHQLGGYRVQGREPAAAAQLRRDAAELEAIGAFALVLECVPAELAAAVTGERAIPTIGIGAGGGTRGQILVLSDLLGLDGDFAPGFVRRYLDGQTVVRGAVAAFVADVRAGRFPSAAEVPA